MLLLTERCKMNEWAKSSLVPFGIKNIYYIPSEKSVLVKNLCMPQLKPTCHSYYKKELIEIRNFYLSYIKLNNQSNLSFGEKIYISRKKAPSRRVYNEEELERLLNKVGFRIVDNEDYNFFDQISIYSKAKYLVSIHGAGLTNMIWMPKNSTILEMHKKKTNKKDRHSLVYWYLADTLGHKYYHQICDPVDPKSGFFVADIIVNISILKKNLELMIE